MKKNEKIFLFGFLYLVFFTLLYTFIFFDAQGILFIFLILAVYNLPSFIFILIISSFNKFIKIKIPDALYYILSILVFIISFLLFTNENNDPKNTYPIFEEHISIIILICLMSNIMGYLSIKFINKKIGKNAT